MLQTRLLEANALTRLSEGVPALSSSRRGHGRPPHRQSRPSSGMKKALEVEASH